jgi:hypothetical protein
MRRRRRSLRVVFGRLVFSAAPLALAACPAPSCPASCGSATVVLDGGFPAGLTDAGPLDGGPVELTENDCELVCPPPAETWTSCELVSTNPPTVQCSCEHVCTIIGRRPAGLRAAPARAATPFAEFLATSAHLEGAAVVAFEGLAREVRRHNGPASLVARLRAAARDEVRHERAMTRLARREGIEPPAVEVDAEVERSLEAFALENATEGCVFETHAALLATWQSRAASDPVIRRVMRGIARDETRHAEASWAIARWANPRLTSEERRRVAAAREEAVAQLRRAARQHTDPTLVNRAGLPTGAVAAHLADGLAKEIGRLGRALAATG